MSKEQAMTEAEIQGAISNYMGWEFHDGYRWPVERGVEGTITGGRGRHVLTSLDDLRPAIERAAQDNATWVAFVNRLKKANEMSDAPFAIVKAAYLSPVPYVARCLAEAIVESKELSNE